MAAARTGDQSRQHPPPASNLVSMHNEAPPPPQYDPHVEHPRHPPKSCEASMSALLALLKDPPADGRRSSGSSSLQLAPSSMLPSPFIRTLLLSDPSSAERGAAAVRPWLFPEELLPSQQQGLRVLPSLQVSRAASSAQQTPLAPPMQGRMTWLPGPSCPDLLDPSSTLLGRRRDSSRTVLDLSSVPPRA